MATKAKDATAGKEKTKPASPASKPHSPDVRKKPALKHSTSCPPATGQSAKPLPNYLRPTVSSRLADPTSQRKKPVSPDTSSPKPSLLRRRSFDKPPSPPVLQKTASSLNLRPKTFRSSSISSKSPSSSKPKSSPTARKPEPPLAKPRSARKSPSPTGKGTGVAAAPALTPPEPLDNVSNAGSEHEAPEEVASGFVNEGKEDSAEILISEKKEVVAHEEAPLQPGDSESVGEEQDRYPAEVQKEENEKEITDIAVTGELSHIADESNVKGEDPEETAVPEVGEEVQKAEIFSGANEEDVPAAVAMEAESLDLEGKGSAENAEQVDAEMVERVVSKEEKEAAGGGEEEKAEPEPEPEPSCGSQAPPQQGAQGKKDSPAYNDVIEETASKLLEKRKNKVKALVGAFETVISLQEPEA